MTTGIWHIVNLVFGEMCGISFYIGSAIVVCPSAKNLKRIGLSVMSFIFVRILSLTVFFEQSAVWLVAIGMIWEFLSILLIYHFILKLSWTKSLLSFLLLGLILAAYNIATSFFYYLIQIEPTDKRSLASDYQIIEALFYLLFIAGSLYLAYCIRPLLSAMYKEGRKLFQAFVAYAVFTLLTMIASFFYMWDATVNERSFQHALPLLISYMIISVAASIWLLIIFFGSDRKTRALEKQTHAMQMLGNILDELRIVKHRQDNLLAAIRGYAEKKESQKIINLLDEVALYSPKGLSAQWSAIYHLPDAGLSSMLAEKLNRMSEKGIAVKLHIGMQQIPSIMKMADLIEVLGIFIDNAIEAVDIVYDEIRVDLTETDVGASLSISNTCKQQVDLNKIFEKGWSTKGDHRGYGLWQVKRIMQRYPQVGWETVCENGLFQQTLLICLTNELASTEMKRENMEQNFT